MLETFSIRAVELIETAKNLVKINNQTNKEELVNTFYLLLSMFNANDTICHFLLNELEISLNELNSKYLEIENNEIEGNIFTKEFEKLVVDAEQLAQDLKSEYVYDEHLFYVMLSNNHLTATKVLISLNINIEQLKQDIVDIFNFYGEDLLVVKNIDKNESKHLINLSLQEHVHTYIPRKDYINQLIYVLRKKQKNNPLLIGQAGVGKTHLVYELSKVLNKEIYELDLGCLISGTKYRGEMEEKLIDSIKYCIDKDAILFIDEVHNIVGAGSNDGSLDAANILKPYLSKGKLKLIAATTLDEYYRYIEKDKALSRRFQTIFIDEPTVEETYQILKGIKKDYCDYYKTEINDDLLKYIVDVSYNYIPNKTFPDKAIDLLDETLSRYVLTKKDIKQVVHDVVNSHLGINIPSMDTLLNAKLYYTEFIPLYLRKLYPVNCLNNLGKISVNKLFKLKLLLKDLNKLFGLKEENILEIDLNDFDKSESLNNLIGSAKGYVGYNDGGLLYNHILKYPFSLIYLKNFETASTQIKIFFDSLLKKSFIIDSHQRKIYLKNVLFLIETKEQKTNIGFNNQNKNNSLNYDLIVNNVIDENNELFNKLLKKGIIIEGFKDLTKEEQINLYYKAFLKPIGKYLINKNNHLELISTN